MRLVPHPVLCNYYLTYRCNASCSFCDIWEKPSPYVTLEAATRNLRDLKRLGVRVIDFTGGEPLLHRQLPELLQLAKGMGFITTVTTNGLLYPKQAEKLKGLVDMLHFSLDAADAPTHDGMRGVPCFEAVLRSIDIARALGERPDILFTAFSSNMGHIEKVYEEICQPNGLVLLLNPVFAYNQVDTLGGLTAEELAQLRAWGKKPGIYLNDAFVQLRLDGGNQTSRPICKAGSSTIVISPQDELVLPCYHLGEQSLPIEGRLYELWRSAQVQALVAQEGRLPACQGCAINCYMQPSFAVEMNRYWWRALPSTLKYVWEKRVWQR